MSIQATQHPETHLYMTQIFRPPSTGYRPRSPFCRHNAVWRISPQVTPGGFAQNSTAADATRLHPADPRWACGLTCKEATLQEMLGNRSSADCKFFFDALMAHCRAPLSTNGEQVRHYHPKFEGGKAVSAIVMPPQAHRELQLRQTKQNI